MEKNLKIIYIYIYESLSCTHEVTALKLILIFKND